jgi:hypothetical protein
MGLRPSCRAAADRLLDYVRERREMIKYPEFSAKGWQIGSGPTEATCKTLTARLKGSGTRWDAENAEAIMEAAIVGNRSDDRCRTAPQRGAAQPAVFRRHNLLAGSS